MEEVIKSPPLYSTFALFTEFILSGIIYFTIYQGYKYNKFHAKLAAFALLYEIIFNITYMTSRFFSETKEAKTELSFVVGLAIAHGILSLIMFISLIIFFIMAWKNYHKGVNYFKVHKNLTITFLIFWTLAVLSGALFYFMEYII